MDNQIINFLGEDFLVYSATNSDIWKINVSSSVINIIHNYLKLHKSNISLGIVVKELCERSIRVIAPSALFFNVEVIIKFGLQCLAAFISQASLQGNIF